MIGTHVLMEDRTMMCLRAFDSGSNFPGNLWRMVVVKITARQRRGKLNWKIYWISTENSWWIVSIECYMFSFFLSNVTPEEHFHWGNILSHGSTKIHFMQIHPLFHQVMHVEKYNMCRSIKSAWIKAIAWNDLRVDFLIPNNKRILLQSQSWKFIGMFFKR